MIVLAPQAREALVIAIRGTVDLLLANAQDADLYQMLSGLSSLAYQAIGDSMQRDQMMGQGGQQQHGQAATSPQQMSTMATMPQGGQYL